ncbi:MAG: hypothetical protein E6Q24_14780 [Chitinophagaceae bacterium]|nr:MAG: hypothetical protein E6Q24_14780 [Chitinophagaceae bacterium]
MAFNSKILTSIFGRRLGLQRLSTAQSGGAQQSEFLVGPDDFRVGVSTAETTSTSLKPHGVSMNLGTSAASSAVYTLEPPIPGVRKWLASSTANGPAYVNTSGAVIVSSVGSTQATIRLSTTGNPVELIGLTTALWATYVATASGNGFSAST